MAGLKDSVFGCGLGPHGFCTVEEKEGRNPLSLWFFVGGSWGMFDKFFYFVLRFAKLLFFNLLRV